jgi:cytosine/adenosine deaminase-related metal-dependent hydrolase
VRLAEFDLIDSKTLVAHGLYLSDADIALLNSATGSWYITLAPT